MTPLSCFSLVQHPGDYTTWPLRTPLLRHGEATGANVEGYQLLHQYQTRHGVLLITDFSCPFEESTHFTLLDAKLRIVAETGLAVPYGSFLLDRVSVVDDCALDLCFHDVDRWRLQLRQARFPWRRSRISLQRQ